MRSNADKAAIRRDNLRKLCTERSQTEISRGTGFSLSQLGQWLSGDRNMSEGSAARLEKALRLPTGWMDSQIGAPPAKPPAPSHPVLSWDKPNDLPDNEFAIVERRAVKLSAGDGQMVFEEEDLPPLAFRADFLRAKHVSRRSNLVIVYADGDSMEPTILDGDAVLCDRGQVHVIDGEVYAIDYSGQLKVKRLQKRFDGGLVIISDNKEKYPPEALTPEQAEFITILGRVLWRGGSL